MLDDYRGYSPKSLLYVELIFAVKLPACKGTSDYWHHISIDGRITGGR
jgi:hypothetical protein